MRDQLQFLSDPLVPVWGGDQLALFGAEAEALLPSLAAAFGSGRDSVGLVLTESRAVGAQLLAPATALRGRVWAEGPGCAHVVVINTDSSRPARFHAALRWQGGWPKALPRVARRLFTKELHRPIDARDKAFEDWVASGSTAIYRIGDACSTAAAWRAAVTGESATQ